MNPIGCDSGAAASALGNVLHLTATPVFAMMALLAGLLDAAPTEVLCAPGDGAFSLTGMGPMYVLMSIFHAGPWIRLMSSR